MKKAIFEGLLRECLPSRTNEAIEWLRAVNGLLLHTRAFLNAHQNNLSKPRDAFLRCLMGGQIGNHFNKIPLRSNCISQEKTRGEAEGTATAEPLPAVFGAFEKESIDCVDRFTVDVRASGMREHKSQIVGTLRLAFRWIPGTSVSVTAWKQEFVLRVFEMFAEGAEREKASARLFLHAIFLRLKRQ